MSLLDDLASAIGERRVVLLRYGDASQARTCHPHVLFESTAGTMCLDAVQVAGETGQPDSLPGWRQFRFDRIHSVEVLDRRFHPDPELNLSSPKYAKIWAHCV